MFIKKVLTVISLILFSTFSLLSFALGVTQRIVLPTDGDTNITLDMPRGIVYQDRLLVFYKGTDGKAYYNYTMDMGNNEFTWHASNEQVLVDNEPINTKSFLEPAVLNKDFLFLFRKNDNEKIRHVHLDSLSDLETNTWERNDETLYTDKVMNNVTLINLPQYTNAGVSEMLMAGVEKKVDSNCGSASRPDKVAEKQNLHYNQAQKSLFDQDDFIRLDRECYDSKEKMSHPPALVHEDLLSADSLVHYFLPRANNVISYYRLTGEDYDAVSDEQVLEDATTESTPAAVFHNGKLYLFFINQADTKDNQIYFLTATKVINDLGETVYQWSAIKQLHDTNDYPVTTKANYGLSVVKMGEDVFLLYADKANNDRVTILRLED